MADSLPAVHDSEIPSDIDDVELSSLALFHSSIPSDPFPSQATAAAAASIVSADQASEAVMWDEPIPALSANKPKRHRDGHTPSHDTSKSTAEAVSQKAKRKHKRPRSEKLESEILDSCDEPTVTTSPKQAFLPLALEGADTVQSSDLVHDGSGDIDDDKAELSVRSKRKRKQSDSLSDKRQKKRRSQYQAVTQDQEGQEGVSPLASLVALMQSEQGAYAPCYSVIKEKRANVAEPNSSSTTAHSDPHSPSCNVGVRESSVPSPVVRRVDIDLGTDVAAAEERVNLAHAYVEAPARETWTEHQNNQGSLTSVQGQRGSPAASDAEDLDSAPVLRTRSTRKKAKPTFFDQSPTQAPTDAEDRNREALQELPSPQALTPKPRNRAKVAAKKTYRGKRPKAERVSMVTRPEKLEDVEEETEVNRPARRNRLAGFTQGRFTDEELARIARAVEEFRAEHNLSQQQVNQVSKGASYRGYLKLQTGLTVWTQMIHAPGGTTAGDAHAQLWSLVFAECPSRQRQKIINITRKKFHNFVARATWTPDQDAELSELVHVHGRQWSKIAAIINRHPEDLRDRYRNYLVCGQNQRKDAWDDDEELRLTQEVIIAMRDVDELRKQPDKSHLLNCSYEELIDWQLISERMNRTRSRLQCITKWKSLNFRTHGKDKLISCQPDANISFRLEKARRQIAAIPDEDRFRLVLAIQATGVGKDSKIPWQRLVDKRFRNQWHRPTQMLLWRRLRQSIPDLEAKTTRDAALILVQQYNQSGQLPEVDGDGFDDIQEMRFIQSLSASFSGVNTTATADKSKSAEHVVNSDVDEPESTTNGTTAEATMVDDLEIDPALTKTPAAAKKMATAKKTGSGKPPSKKKTKKAPMALMDPTEDGDEKADGAADYGGVTDATQTRRGESRDRKQKRLSVPDDVED